MCIRDRYYGYGESFSAPESIEDDEKINYIDLIKEDVYKRQACILVF